MVMISGNASGGAGKQLMVYCVRFHCVSPGNTRLLLCVSRLIRLYVALIAMPLLKEAVLRQRESIKKASEAFLRKKSDKNTREKPPCIPATTTATPAATTGATSTHKRKCLSKECGKRK